jgi:subtilisin family serine protease
VTAAIKEKTPFAELHAIKLFDRDLTASVTALVSALDWAVRRGMKIINLSLGTVRLQHERVLRAAVRRALDQKVIIVSARSDEGIRWLPGILPGVVPVELDASCPRRYASDGRVGARSRPVWPIGVPPARI